jgi:hypothetical protein
MGRFILMHIAIMHSVVIAAIAWAGTSRGGDRATASVTQLELSQVRTPTSIHGTLNCIFPETNTGKPCTLSLTDRKTGDTFRVIGSKTAMALYQNGTTAVVARGQIHGKSLRVDEIQQDTSEGSHIE